MRNRRPNIEGVPGIRNNKAAVGRVFVRELIALIALFLFYLTSQVLVEQVSLSMINVVGALILSAILIASSMQHMRAAPLIIWTPLFWFRIATIMFFGLGAIVPYIINEETREYMALVNVLYEDEAVKLNMVNVASIFMVIVMCSFIMRNNQKNAGKGFSMLRGRTLRTIALSFAAIGIFVKYVIVIPAKFGHELLVVSNLVGNLSNLTTIAILLLFIAGLKSKGPILFFGIALVALEMATGALLFSKTRILFPPVMVFLAYLHHYPTRKVMIVGSICLVTIYSFVQPMVNNGRYVVSQNYTNIMSPGFGARVEALTSYFSADRLERDVSNGIQAIGRFSYANLGTYVIGRYDSGDPGDTMKYLPYIFIPRIIWPEKPIMSNIGIELNESLFGTRTSSMATGWFAEAYWNGGWWGVLVYMAGVGMVIGYFSVFSMWVMRRGYLLLLPIVFFGIQMGLWNTGFIVTSIAGTTVMAVAIYIVLVIFNRVLMVLFGINLLPAVRRRMARQGGAYFGHNIPPRNLSNQLPR